MDRGVLQDRISEEVMLPLGGHPHFVDVSGARDSRRVVLVCHGGPGVSELAMVRAGAYAQLQEHAVVITWDQRGTARSYTADVPLETMNVAQLVADTIALADWAAARFGCDRVSIAGHSAGGTLALLAARAAPARFGAVFVLCPYVSFRRSAPITTRMLATHAARCRNLDALADLRLLGEPPYGDPRAVNDVHAKWAARFGGLVCGGRERAYDLFDRFQSIPGYTDAHYELARTGQEFSRRCLFDDYAAVDLLDRVPDLDVPIVAGVGRHDLLNCTDVTRQWFDALIAPQKRFIWFEHSAHFPHFDEPALFQQAVLQLVVDADQRRKQS